LKACKLTNFLKKRRLNAWIYASPHKGNCKRDQQFTCTCSLGAVTRIQSSCQYLVEVSPGSFVLERRYMKKERKRRHTGMYW
jgi:hypothetical protein